MNQRNVTIDGAKYIASLFIIGIHTAFLKDCNSTVGFFFVDIIFRLAVPFFAICSGYLMAVKWQVADQERGRLSNIVWKQWKSIFFIYVAWSVIYLLYSIPGWMKVGWFSIHAFLDYGINAIKVGSHYHFWYLISILFALPFFYLIVAYVKARFIKVLAIILWMIKAVSYVYITWLPSGVRHIFQMMDKMSSLRDGLFCILPLLLIGYDIAGRKETRGKGRVIALLFSFILLITEAFFLRSKGLESVSFIIFTLPTAWLLFECVLVIQMKNAPRWMKSIGAVSLFIYCIHPIFVETMGKWVTSSVILFVITTILSTLTGYIYVFIRRKIRRG